MSAHICLLRCIRIGIMLTIWQTHKSSLSLCEHCGAWKTTKLYLGYHQLWWYGNYFARRIANVFSLAKGILRLQTKTTISISHIVHLKQIHTTNELYHCIEHLVRDPNEHFSFIDFVDLLEHFHQHHHLSCDAMRCDAIRNVWSFCVNAVRMHDDFRWQYNGKKEFKNLEEILSSFICYIKLNTCVCCTVYSVHVHEYVNEF